MSTRTTSKRYRALQRAYAYLKPEQRQEVIDGLEMLCVGIYKSRLNQVNESCRDEDQHLATLLQTFIKAGEQ